MLLGHTGKRDGQGIACAFGYRADPMAVLRSRSEGQECSRRGSDFHILVQGKKERKKERKKEKDKENKIKREVESTNVILKKET